MTPADTIQRQKLAIAQLRSALRGIADKLHELSPMVEREIAAAEAVTKGDNEEGRVG